MIVVGVVMCVIVVPCVVVVFFHIVVTRDKIGYNLWIKDRKKNNWTFDSAL